MTKICTVPPAVLAVTLADAKENMRIDGNDLDALVSSWVAGTVAALEHEIGQCMMEQTWTVTLDEFPSIPMQVIGSAHVRKIMNAIDLPHPVISVTSIKYLDLAGDEQILAPSAYRISRKAYSTSVAPVVGTVWPITLTETDVVVVTCVCGYGDTAAATPPNVKLYVLAKLVEQFDPVSSTMRDLKDDTVQSKFITRLLDACRSYP